MEKRLLKQECPLAFVVLAWLMYVGAIPVLAFQRQWLLLAVWIVLAPALMWAYIRWFPSISPYMGYGRLDDRPAVAVATSPVDVTVYTAIGCPFCPIVKRRLTQLQPKMGFQLHDVDVTARPDILTRKGIWSVPVVEIGDRRLVGHATSEQLANLISGSQVRAA
jgi:Glutaredoxin and related proteins